MRDRQRPARVLIARSDGPGGVANYYRKITRHLGDRHRHFIVHDPAERRGIFKVAKLIMRLPRFMRELLDHDAVLVNPSLNARSYYRDAALLALARLMRRKAIVFFRGWSDDFEASIRRGGLSRFVWSLFYRRASAFIALGSVFRDKLTSMPGGDRVPIHVETTVADEDPPSASPRPALSQSRRLRCLFISRLVEGKGVLDSLRLFALLRQRLDDWDLSLTVAGDGPLLEPARRFVREHGIDGVEFVGYVSGARKSALYGRSDLLLFTSESEGLPNVILEAMLCGLMIASTPVGGIPDIVRDEENGILLARGPLADETIEHDAERLALLLRREGAAERIAGHNRESARTRFLPETVGRRLASILDATVAGEARVDPTPSPECPGTREVTGDTIQQES